MTKRANQEFEDLISSPKQMDEPDQSEYPVQYIIRQTTRPLWGPRKENGKYDLTCPFCPLPLAATRSTLYCNSTHKGVFTISKKALSVLQTKKLTAEPLDKQLFKFPLCVTCKKCTLTITTESQYQNGGYFMFICDCKNGDKLFIRLDRKGGDIDEIIEHNFETTKFEQYITTITPKSKRIKLEQEQAITDDILNDLFKK